MKTIQISFYCTVTKMRFLDDDKATAAYEKISTAIAEYRKFKNDTLETIEVDTETGLCSIRLERVDSVLIEGDEGRERMLRQDYEIERMARSIREEMGLPDLSPAPSAVR